MVSVVVMLAVVLLGAVVVVVVEVVVCGAGRGFAGRRCGCSCRLGDELIQEGIV